MAQYDRGQEFLAFLPTIGQELPFSLTLLRDLFDMTSEHSDVSMHVIANTLGQDQGLTTKVLAMANSAFYGLQAKVSTLPRALTLLGLREIRHVVLILGVQSICSRSALPHDFDLQGYWKHQLQVAAICRDLGHMVHRAGKLTLDPDLLYTTGLLHDLGKLLTAMHRPSDWEAIHSRANQEALPAFVAEDRHWGLEHGLVGAITLNAWNLPQELTEPVNWHHAPHLAGDYTPQARLCCIADSLCHALEDNESEYINLLPHAETSLDALQLDLVHCFHLAQERFADNRLEEMAALLQ